MRIKPAGSDWIDTNNELIVNLIKLQDLNRKSEKRVNEALAKIDREEICKTMMTEIDKMMRSIEGRKVTK